MFIIQVRLLWFYYCTNVQTSVYYHGLVHYPDSFLLSSEQRVPVASICSREDKKAMISF